MDADDVMRLRRSIHRLARQMNAHPSSEGLATRQASVLNVIAAYGPFSLSEVAEIEDLNPTMLSRVVANLESRGLIRRFRDPEDGRVIRVAITENGRETHERIKEERSALVARCVIHLTPKQVDALVKAIPSLEALAHELQRAARERDFSLGTTG